MEVSVNELMVILSELPKDVKTCAERRIGKSVSYIDDNGVVDEKLRIDMYFSKNLQKTGWNIEFPTLPSTPKSFVR